MSSEPVIRVCARYSIRLTLQVPRRLTAYSFGSTAMAAATSPQLGQRSTKPAPSYRRCEPIGFTLWHVAQTRGASVISATNTSRSTPAMLFPSVCSSISTSSWSEALGVHGGRQVPQLHEQPRRFLHERGRPADVDVRMRVWPGSDVGQHLAVDAAREALPTVGRLSAGEGHVHRDAETLELLSV